MRSLSATRSVRWHGPPCEAKQASIADCMRIKLPDLPRNVQTGRLAWRWPDGDITGAVYRQSAEPTPHVVLAFGTIRQIIPFIPAYSSGWVSRAFLCPCGHRTRILYMPRNGDAWRCKVCYRLTPAAHRHEGRPSVKAISVGIRWATITARARTTRAQPRAAGAALFGPSFEWSTLDELPALADWIASIGDIHRF